MHRSAPNPALTRSATLLALSVAVCLGGAGPAYVSLLANQGQSANAPSLAERRAADEREPAIAALMARLSDVAKTFAGCTAVTDDAADLVRPLIAAPGPLLQSDHALGLPAQRVDLSHLNLPPPTAA